VGAGQNLAVSEGEGEGAVDALLLIDIRVGVGAGVEARKEEDDLTAGAGVEAKAETTNPRAGVAARVGAGAKGDTARGPQARARGIEKEGALEEGENGVEREAEVEAKVGANPLRLLRLPIRRRVRGVLGAKSRNLLPLADLPRNAVREKARITILRKQQVEARAEAKVGVRANHP